VDEEEIKKYFKKKLEDYETAIKSKDFESVGSFWVSDGCLLSPELPKICGWDNLKETLKAFVTNLVDWKFSFHDVYQLSDDSVIVTGKISAFFEDNKKDVSSSVSFWEKQLNGDWKGTIAVAVNID
jgi:ketosteroid isomerase-like protein